ncbi:ABC transporter ATP-binding protein [Bordetella bronchialis]|uniref:ABC transporter ATP-binding protein n=1 Tax=Bordetella bronchialis TaxID=463025 RepID=A0A193FZ06_9BORD|nr:ABC transporter ATP-binding protein [Bordetella bronchialis]ANN67529.1 ABC transporter ATP-binding protein [Bordetella bronchialis]ANN72618.1 ABC transporter ATP-binding protein [Bordetella bronchialis]
MASIELDLSHSYVAHPAREEDYALLPLQYTFRDGGAYALLGPSGCGKTTLLNCVSGLLRPSGGHILFDGRDVTQHSPQQRNIAQVFQFPVVYDTMTVAENLAFPLRNRGVPPQRVRERVGRIAEMLELSAVLDRRASGLAADAKQKISLGRGLVRSDVSAILFDEPLTVIDPHLKWALRRKLKEIHQEFKLTLIYVTHDQTEALTFADQVVVMSRGKVMQVGTADDLFLRPAHTFVGHFIGSPGMNFLPARWEQGSVHVGTHDLGWTPPATESADAAAALAAAGTFTLGIRPEFASLCAPRTPGALPVAVTRIQDVGTYLLLTGNFEGHPVRARLPLDSDAAAAGTTAWLSVLNAHSCFYRDEELIR